MGWERLCATTEVMDGEITQAILADGSKVIVLRTASGAIKVFQGICPHQKRSLGDGYLDGDVLTCVAHMWQFDVNTGEGMNAAVCGISSYPVRIENGYILTDPTGVAVLARWR